MKVEDPHVPGFPLRFLVKGHYPHGDAVQNLGFVHLNKQFMVIKRIHFTHNRIHISPVLTQKRTAMVWIDADGIKRFAGIWRRGQS